MLVSVLDAGYKTTINVEQKKKICKNVSTYYSYMGGYGKVVGDYYTFRRWYQLYNLGVNEGTSEKVFECKKTSQQIPYTKSLDTRFPGFLHKCYRYATSVVGADAKLTSIIHIMQEYASAMYPNCPIRSTLSLNKYQFDTFFSLFQGKYFAPVTKPRLTIQHIKDRLQ
jgi:hypothetical protein